MRRIILASACLILVLGAGFIYFYQKQEAERKERQFAGELSAFGRAYHVAADDGPGPSSLIEMQEWKESFPRVYEMIQRGELQVVWKGRLEGGREKLEEFILVWEKDAESRISWALTASGVPFRITAEAYKLMPKLASVNEKK